MTRVEGYFRVCIWVYRASGAQPPRLENQVEKDVENETETTVTKRLYE